MREETAEWLAPMVEALSRRADASETVGALIGQATMPAAEADTPYHNWADKHVDGSGVTTAALDWIRYGQLLRAELGWDHYPEAPSR